MGKPIRTAERKVIELGGSLMITMPKQFCEENGIKKGDVLDVHFWKRGNLVVSPKVRGGEKSE